jgi:hypothetical protein
LEVDAKPDTREPPRVIDPAPGCSFRRRCPYATEVCGQNRPRLRLLRPDHEVACNLALEDFAKKESGRQNAGRPDSVSLSVALYGLQGL